ncbi:MAG: hypothetical protein ACLT3A_00445 [Subdoligranulum sp.]
MAVNKVVINDKIALDLTGDTVTPSDLVEGVTAHDATGMQITGTRPATSGTDTSDATATAKDIARGKTAYVQGEKVTGTLYEYVKGKKLEMWVSAGGSQYLIVNKRGNICISMPHELNDEILRIGCTIELGADPSLFGDAVAADVAKGKTMTSAAGLKVVGTNTNDADTSDATATAADIAAGKTAYVQGAKVTGKLTEYLAGETLSYYTSGDEEITIKRDSDSDNISIKIHCFDDDKIMRHNSYIKLGADAILFGNATAADVAKGKTFTSAAGVNVTGTAEPAESNNNVEAYAITSTSPSVSFKRTDGAIKIWGYGTMTSSGGWGQQTTSLVAFEGDKYHKGAIYGSPSSTSLSLSISNGKLTGLPSGLTAISAIVTRGI